MRVMKLTDLELDTPTAVEVEDENIVLIRKADLVYALKDECTHEDFPLSEGWVDETHIHCAFHGAKFALVSGERGGLPALEDLETFPVKIVDGWIEVKV